MIGKYKYNKKFFVVVVVVFSFHCTKLLDKCKCKYQVKIASLLVTLTTTITVKQNVYIAQEFTSQPPGSGFNLTQQHLKQFPFTIFNRQKMCERLCSSLSLSLSMFIGKKARAFKEQQHAVLFSAQLQSRSLVAFAILKAVNQ